MLLNKVMLVSIIENVLNMSYDHIAFIILIIIRIC